MDRFRSNFEERRAFEQGITHWLSNAMEIQMLGPNSRKKNIVPTLVLKLNGWFPLYLTTKFYSVLSISFYVILLTTPPPPHPTPGPPKKTDKKHNGTKSMELLSIIIKEVKIATQGMENDKLRENDGLAIIDHTLTIVTNEFLLIKLELLHKMFTKMPQRKNFTVILIHYRWDINPLQSKWSKTITSSRKWIFLRNWRSRSGPMSFVAMEKKVPWGATPHPQKNYLENGSRSIKG